MASNLSLKPRLFMWGMLLMVATPPSVRTTAQDSDIALEPLLKLPLVGGDVAIGSVDVQQVAFSPDSSMLAVGSNDDKIRIWETDTWNLVKSLDANVYGNWANMAWSPDGELLAAGVEEGVSPKEHSVRVWDTTNWNPVKTLKFTPKFDEDGYRLVRAIAWSPDGTQLAASLDPWSFSLPIIVRIWNVNANYSVTRDSAVQDALRITTIEWSPDGTLLATGGWDDAIRIWDASNGAEVRTLTDHIDNVHWLAWRPDGSELASGSWDFSARIWNTTTWNTTHVLRHDGWVRSIAWSPDGSRLATSSSNSKVRIWDGATWETLYTIDVQPIPYLDWSSNNSWLAVAGSGVSTEIWIWDTTSFTESPTPPSPTKPPTIRTNTNAPTRALTTGSPSVLPTAGPTTDVETAATTAATAASSAAAPISVVRLLLVPFMILLTYLQ